MAEGRDGEGEAEGRNRPDRRYSLIIFGVGDCGLRLSYVSSLSPETTSSSEHQLPSDYHHGVASHSFLPSFQQIALCSHHPQPAHQRECVRHPEEAWSVQRSPLFIQYYTLANNMYSCQTASLVVCADGGANRYYDLMKAHGRESIDVRQASIQ